MKTLVILLITISCLGLAFGELYSGLQNKKVERTIDLSSQFARHTLQIEIENTGKTSTSEYFVAIQEQNLAYLDAKDQAGVSLKVTKGATETSGKQSYTLYSVELSSALAAGSTAKITVNAVYTHVQTPFPASVAQDEKQLVVYNGNHFFFSPYKTASQTTTVKLSSSTLESYSKESPSSVSGNTITYGPYSEKAALSVSDMKLHYENNKPFLTASSVTKEVEVSQWGNVAVEETYELKHDGAKLKGHFSRFAYQRSYRLNSNVIASLRQTLPRGAADVYYRDEIGNISTSNVNYHADEGVVFDLVPRFPLFGGWSIGFLYGYNLPTETYLHTSYQAGVYALNVSFAGSLSEVAADELTLRVILPEGATDIEFVAPFPVDSHSFATHYTYLDTSGRPVLIIKKKNVVPEHNQEFFVLYKFSQTSLLREPILLIGAYFSLFALILLWGRLPLSVGESKATYGPNADRVLNALAHFKEISEQRNELHEALNEAVSNFVKTKNDKTWTTAKKVNDTTVANLTKDVNGILAELDEVATDFGRRAREIQKKEEKKAQLGSSLIDLELNYKIHKKIEKSTYDAQRGDLEKQFKTLEEEIENAVYDLTENL